MAEITIPDKLKILFEPHRYKIIYGGRGGAKSHSVAKALLVLGANQVHRILCAREVQNSIKQSVHTLLSDQVKLMGLSGFYQILNNEIRGINGTTINYTGLWGHSVESLKSFEGITICWLEEGQTSSKRSLDILPPTIRMPDSEIWITMNPELDEDEAYKRFVLNPPSSAILVAMNWRDNPWFPDVLREEMEECKKRSEDDYLHIWEGHTRQVLEGAIFADGLRQAKLDNRITDVHHDPTKPVHTFWDLGWNSITGRTAIIMAQSAANNYHVIDYLEDAEHTINWYVSELQKKPYSWGTDWLPHDAGSTNIVAGGNTVEKIMKNLGRNIRVIPKTKSVGSDIEVCKTIFPKIRIDKNKCAELIQCLNRYRYSIDEETGLRSKLPEPNVWIHGADAFRQFGRAITDEKKPIKKNPRERSVYGGSQGWMS